jgi:hypothetical protein
MQSTYEIVNTDEVELRISITATKAQWNALRLALPTNSAPCSMLKGMIEKMMNANVLTVTKSQ